LNWYLDASVLVPLFVLEPRSQAVTAALAAVEAEFIVSSLAAGEFASSISRRVRMNGVAAETAGAWINLFDEWVFSDTLPLKVEDSDITRAAALVRRFDLKLLMPDAIHVALCERHNLTMVTLDKRLAEAAGAIDVAIIVPE
jgi:uncharacterized protein